MEIGPGDTLMVDGYDVAWMFVIFREVEGFPDYLVSSRGDVYSRHVRGSRAKWKRPWHKIGQRPNMKGYLIVTLFNDKKKLVKTTHSLVLSAFRGPRPDGWQACHFPDQTKSNNNLANLRWGTRESNNQDSMQAGTHSYGSRHGNAKLTEDDVTKMRTLRRQGWTIRELKEMFSISYRHAYGILKGEWWVRVPVESDQEITHA